MWQSCQQSPITCHIVQSFTSPTATSISWISGTSDPWVYAFTTYSFISNLWLLTHQTSDRWNICPYILPALCRPHLHISKPQGNLFWWVVYSRINCMKTNLSNTTCTALIESDQTLCHLPSTSVHSTTISEMLPPLHRLLKYHAESPRAHAGPSTSFWDSAASALPPWDIDICCILLGT